MSLTIFRINHKGRGSFLCKSPRVLCNIGIPLNPYRTELRISGENREGAKSCSQQMCFEAPTQAL